LNGLLDKFVGDLLMAIFGAPLSGGNDPLNAVRCAVRMLRLREELNTTSRHQLRIGIGLATGRVVAGRMGSDDRLSYTVVGERVNLASRFCSLAVPGQGIIDEATRTQMGELIEAVPRPALTIKGFTGSVPAYELVEVHSWEIRQDQSEAEA
jgi:class 3 adenylate cyclase